MSIVVGGGTGFVGRAFARMGANKGYNIISVSRNAGANKITWTDVSRNGLPDDCVGVISMSGEKVLQPFKSWTDKVKKEIRESRLEKTNILSKAIQAASKPPKVFVSFSGIAYYKPDFNKEYTEDSHVEPYDFLSELSRDWEAAAQLPPDCSTRVVILRTGVVLGKDGGLIENIRLPFYLGGGGPMGNGNQWTSWIHVDDMAGLMWHAVENESVRGVLNGTAPKPVLSKEFTKSFASAMNRPHLIPLPAFAVKIMFGSEGSVIVLEGQKVIPKNTLESGYKFLYPDIDSACKEIVSGKSTWV